MEDNNLYEAPAEETSGKGTCARALYDYQAGEFQFSSLIIKFLLVSSGKFQEVLMRFQRAAV